MVDLNSIEAVKAILEHICTTSQLSENHDSRKWTFVISDGVPYVYASTIQDSLKGTVCEEYIDSSDKAIHVALHERDHILFAKPFENLIFIPGPGHIELNMGKELLNLLGVPMLCRIAQMLGFRTEKALAVVKSGIDHHRTGQILCACLYALSTGLLVPFVRDCLKAEIIPNSDGYINWVVETCGYQYMLYYHFVFTYLLAFNLYTEATRKNYSLRMMAARIQFAPLFYSFKYPKYQVLHLRDLFERAQMPDEIRSYVESHENFSPSGLQNRGQGGNFVQEESNRLIKSFLAPGIPSQEIWTRVCRKAETLKELKTSVCEVGNVNLKYKRHLNEETMIRRELRSTNLLSVSKSDLKSVDGITLDYDLTNLKYNANENYNNYRDSYVRNGKFDCEIKIPIFMTPAEREHFNKIENLKKDEIAAEIPKLVSEVPDSEVPDSYLKGSKRWDRIKQEDLVSLYYEVKQSLDLQLIIY